MDCYLCGAAIVSQDELHEIHDGIEVFRHADAQLCASQPEAVEVTELGEVAQVLWAAHGSVTDYDDLAKAVLAWVHERYVPRGDVSIEWAVGVGSTVVGVNLPHSEAWVRDFVGLAHANGRLDRRVMQRLVNHGPWVEEDPDA